MDTQTPNPKKREIDSAALGASAIAAVIAVSVEKGPFDPVNFIVGVTLATLILAYEYNTKRRWPQSLALGAVLGLCSLLFLGYLFERLVFHTDHEAKDSNVTHTCMVWIWIGVILVFSVVDRVWLQKKIHDTSGFV